MKNPHNLLNNLGGGFWQCDFCSFEGTWVECHAISCTYVYPPCEGCGQTPTCAPDCALILEILSDHSVYVIEGEPS